VRRALVLLTCGALLTLVVEVTDTFRAPGRALWALVLGGMFSLIATVGFGWVQTRGRLFAVGYVAVQLPLGMAMFATSHTTVGAALLLVVLVMQTVLLLSLPVAAVVIAIAPLGHLGMAPREGLRASVGTIVATLFGAVLAELLVREQRARGQLAESSAAGVSTALEVVGAARTLPAEAERRCTGCSRSTIPEHAHTDYELRALQLCADRYRITVAGKRMSYESTGVPGC
jgi:hypothetical protein